MHIGSSGLRGATRREAYAVELTAWTVSEFRSDYPPTPNCQNLGVFSPNESGEERRVRDRF